MITLFEEHEVRDNTGRVIDFLCQRISEVLPGVNLEHIGSTAVPGSVTKGDVDVQLAVDGSAFEYAREILDANFEHNPEMAPEPDFVSYSGRYKGASFGIQLVKEGETRFDFIRWRDALNASPDLLGKYNQIKRRMAGKSVADYRQAKSDFIELQLGKL